MVFIENHFNYVYNVMVKSKTISFKNKLFYGFGSIGVSIMDTFVGGYLTLYVTDVLHLDALLFASLLLAPKIFDVAIDVFIMFFVGKAKTKIGIYKPWLLNAIPMSIAMFLMFTAPYSNLNESGIIILLLVTYFFCNALCDSFYWIPYTAIPGVLTKDKNELVNISSFKSIFENVSSTLVSITIMPILIAFGGHTNPDGWLVAAGIFSALSLLFSLITFFGLHTDKELEEEFTRYYSLKDTFMDYKNILSNKTFILFGVLFILVYIVSYSTSSVSYYFYLYNLGMANQMVYLAILAAVVTILTSILSTYLYKKLGYFITLIIGAFGTIISSILSMLSYSDFLAYLSIFFRAFGSIILLTIIFSYWPVIANKMNTGKVKAPLNNIMGLSNIFGGLAGILGSTLGALIISISKYDSLLETQSNFTLSIIRYISPIINICVMAIFIIISLIGMKQSNKMESSKIEEK